MEIKTKYDFKCQYCNILLSSKRNLDFHEYNICKYQHKCNNCLNTFKSNNYLEVHKKKCCGKFICNKCNKKLSRKQTYIYHISICKQIK